MLLLEPDQNAVEVGERGRVDSAVPATSVLRSASDEVSLDAVGTMAFTEDKTTVE